MSKLLLMQYYFVAPSFEDAVIACKDVSNDKWADYERAYQDKCIIAGAYYGIDNIPKEWIDVLAFRELILNILHRLLLNSHNNL